jgi:uncharacterized protein (TIGR03435 family)
VRGLVLVVALLGAGVTAVSAQAPMSFEAASIKPRPRGATPPQVRMLVTPGRISFQAATLKDCIRWAYGLAEYQVTGGPAWIERAPRWDIEAKAPGPATDAELRQMFRALLAERFAFRAHKGQVEQQVYVLTVAKPAAALKRASDDAARSDDWRLSPLFQASKSGPAGQGRVMTLRTERVTLRYVAEYLTRQLQTPVIDRTGLGGDFAFSVEWETEMPPFDPRSGDRPPQPGSLFGRAGIDAFRDQLGLAVTATHAPVDVLIIDSVEEAPANWVSFEFLSDLEWADGLTCEHRRSGCNDVDGTHS